MMRIVILADLLVILVPLLDAFVGSEDWGRTRGDVRVVLFKNFRIQGALGAQLLAQGNEVVWILHFRIVPLPDLIVVLMVLLDANVTFERRSMRYGDLLFGFD